MIRGGRRRAMAGLASLAWGFGAWQYAPVACAHAGVVKVEPGRKAVLGSSPSRIAITFSEPIEVGYASLAVFDASGREQPHGKIEVAGDDRKRLVLPVDALGPGAYTVKYRALSLDGHVVSGEYGFRVGRDR
jgi:copper resistance protein C